MPKKDGRVRARAWFFRTIIRIPPGYETSYNAREAVLGHFANRERFRESSLPGVHYITFSLSNSDVPILSGFIRGPNPIAESSVLTWLPDEFHVGPDASGFQFAWTPIPGVFEKNDTIMKFLSDVASEQTTRMDYYVDASRPKNPRGRPRSIDHGTSLDSFEPGCSSNPSMNPVESSLQSSLPIESSSTSNVDAASAHDLQSSLGSATSARDLHERRLLMAELQAMRQAAAEMQMEREQARIEREQWERDREWLLVIELDEKIG